MSLDPITAVSDLIKTGLDKFVSDKMPEADKEKLKNDMIMFTMQQGQAEESGFRNFILAYEGAADVLPKGLIWFRSMVRPLFTYAVGYFDYIYFTDLQMHTADSANLLYAVNLIVLLFWFGERAVANSGLMDVLKGWMTKKA